MGAAEPNRVTKETANGACDRLVWKGLLSFGLVSIPVRRHRAARKERIPLHYVRRRTAVLLDEDGASPEKPNERTTRPAFAQSG
jgi:hypothetical protein